MKSSIKVFSVIGLFLFNMPVFSQKILNDATLTYNISVESLDGKTDLAKSFEGAVLTIYIKGNQSRTDMVSALGTESTFYDEKTGKGFILKEYSGQKLMITMDKNNWGQKNQFYHNVVFKIDNQEKIINGYKTNKATGILPDNKSFTVNFTPDFIPGNKHYNNAFTQLQGLPVQYEIVSGNLKFIYSLSRIDQEIVPSSKFEVPKSGFRIMTYDENQQLKKGK